MQDVVSNLTSLSKVQLFSAAGVQECTCHGLPPTKISSVHQVLRSMHTGHRLPDTGRIMLGDKACHPSQCKDAAQDVFASMHQSKAVFAGGL